MLDPFLIRALVAGIGVAMISGVLGCFVVWRRMAYFGDSLAHSALLGIALGLSFGFSLNVGIVVVCAAFSLLLLWLQQKRILPTDTLLGILAHAALSVGMVTISLLDGVRIDLHSILFGDILTVRTEDLWWIYGGGAMVLLLTVLNWPAMTLMTLHEDLARAEGVKTLRTHILFMLLMTVVVAVSIRIVGILLITSMLIIPAATARQLARSPEGMAVLACCFGIGAVVAGLLASLHFDLPSGPTIVTTAATLFLLMVPVGTMVEQRRQ